MSFVLLKKRKCRTGLYAESHGIVANVSRYLLLNMFISDIPTQNFWDPETNSTFLYSDPQQSWNASWWHGEPVCVYMALEKF